MASASCSFIVFRSVKDACSVDEMAAGVVGWIDMNEHISAAHAMWFVARLNSPTISS